MAENRYEKKWWKTTSNSWHRFFCIFVILNIVPIEKKFYVYFFFIIKKKCINFVFMKKKDVIKQLILSFQQRIPVDLKSREVTLPVNSGKIITIAGVRRCGKSSLMLLTINRLIDSGVAREKILFLNFDDERLDFRNMDFDLILQAYRELYPDIPLNEVHVFFDEIQMADRWEQFVRRVYDQETRNIYLSGSNSRMLATEISTSLRGRTLPFELFPLSFREYCNFKMLNTEIHLPSSRAALISAFRNFVKQGGFPEAILSNDFEAERTLQEYYFIMLHKDLVERYGIQNITAIKYFVFRLLANIGKSTSLNKIFNELKSAGIAIGKNSLYQFVEYCEAIYMFFRLTRYDKSFLKETFSDRKFYFIDNGMRRVLQYKGSDDFGQLFENAVFLWLRQQTFFQTGLHFYKMNKECDFVLFDRDRPLRLIQACWDISDPGTLKREVRGLADAAGYLNCNDMTILTAGEEQEIEHGNLIIKVMPAWKEMLLFPGNATG